MADANLAIPQEITDLSVSEQQFSRAVAPTIINGTEGNDILATTANNDVVNALAGNDTVKGSKGNDLINGGQGIDTIDYFSLGGPVRLGVRGKVFKGKDGAFGEDQLLGIETIVGSQGAGDLIDGTTSSSGTVPINVDLARQTLSVIGIPGLGTQNFTVKNFENVNGTNLDDIIAGDSNNNILNGAGGNDTIRGTKGNDTIIGGEGIDTISYLSLGGPVRLGVRGKVFKGKDGAFGEDQILGIETIVGGQGAGDLIDGTTSSSGTVPINVNLAQQTLSVIGIPGLGTQNFTVKNFENVNGTNLGDIITGDRNNNILNGAGGNDILTGTVGASRVSNEIDTLIGGAGNDTFVLGSGKTLFYSGNKNADFATITDFGNGADQIFLGEGNYATNDGVTRLFAVKADGTLDLVAKIAYSLGSDSFSARQSLDLAFSDEAVDPLLATSSFSLSQGQTFGIFTASVA